MLSIHLKHKTFSAFQPQTPGRQVTQSTWQHSWCQGRNDPTEIHWFSLFFRNTEGKAIDRNAGTRGSWATNAQLSQQQASAEQSLVVSGLSASLRLRCLSTHVQLYMHISIHSAVYGVCFTRNDPPEIPAVLKMVVDRRLKILICIMFWMH